MRPQACAGGLQERAGDGGDCIGRDRRALEKLPDFTEVPSIVCQHRAFGRSKKPGNHLAGEQAELATRVCKRLRGSIGLEIHCIKARAESAHHTPSVEAQGFEHRLGVAEGTVDRADDRAGFSGIEGEAVAALWA